MASKGAMDWKNIYQDKATTGDQGAHRAVGTAGVGPDAQLFPVKEIIINHQDFDNVAQN